MVCALVLNVVLVVHVLRGLFGVATSFECVIFIHSLGLGELVDLATDETGEQLFGELVRNWFSYEQSVYRSSVKG